MRSKSLWQIGYATLALMVFAWIPVSATEMQGLSHTQLDNGLELFVVPNHAVPLHFIRIAAQPGSVAGW